MDHHENTHMNKQENRCSIKNLSDESAGDIN